MLIIISATAGAIWGALVAANRKGSRLDVLQYAGSFGIAFALLGLILTVIIHRLAV
jgi:hypothetical protein